MNKGGGVPVSGKEMLKKFKKAGWTVLRQNGSHVILGKNGKRVVVPVHGSKDLGVGLEKKLLKELDATED